MLRTSSAVACAIVVTVCAGIARTDEPAAPCVRTIADADIHLFYDGSFYDGTVSPAACQAMMGHVCTDNDAIDPSKSPLRPGGIATVANYSSYTKGLNGIMIDVSRPRSCTALPAGPLDASGFEFRMGNATSLSGFVPAPAPASIVVLPGAGAGGSDRIVLKWLDNAIPNRNWLRITVKGTVSGGTINLAVDKVFYFGLAIADSGTPGSTRVTVNAIDEVDARNHPRPAGNRAPVMWAWDYNKDSLCGATDEIYARNNPANVGNGLRYYGHGGYPAAP